ncbi:RCC1/BLIP-II [Pseudoneurospora amorphoporcata]|uniref:RCC1/BLIP-II n=1 Tax=Pseudoneurospora amorphoporcata TaxID=241081 RepID=A0AAN6SEV0_9PEZI|nr:RCC1/BLIP-II [Pseudoneurospora amorphoporcata]
MAQQPEQIINRAPREVMDVYVMGANDKGQLCLGPGHREGYIAQSPQRAARLIEDNQVVAMAVGNNHSLALTVDNRVVSWGSNEHGALGRVTHLWKLPDGRWVDYSTVEERDLNPNGPEGRRIDGILQIPMKINWIAIPRHTVFTQVAVSDHASFALTETGQVYGWGAFEACIFSLYYIGENDFIGFHHVHRFYASHPNHLEWADQRPRRYQQSPLKIRFPGTDHPQIVQIACGSNHVLALSKSGLVYSWGTPDMEILGRRFMPRNAGRRNPRRGYAAGADPYANMDHHFAPGLVAGLQNIRYIACGANYSMAVTKPRPRSGTQLCYVWGQNDDMQTTLPLSKATVVATPEHPDAPDGNNMRVVLYPTKAPWLSGIGHRDDEPESAIKSISGSLRYGLAIRWSGWGEAWGNEHEMPNAMGVINEENEPVIPAVPPGNRYTQAPQFAGWHYDREECRWDHVATGKQHSIAVDQEGKIYVWGSNSHHQCGVPRPQNGEPNIDVIDRPTPLQQFLNREGRCAIFVGAGARYSVFGFSKNRFRVGDGGNLDEFR